MRLTLTALVLLMTFHAASAVEPVTNSAGLKASVSVKRQDNRWFVIGLTLENTGTKAIQVKNPESEKISGMRLKAGDHDAIPAEAGKWKFTKAGAAKLSEIAPGGLSDFEVKWKFDPKLEKDEYDWSLTITNLFIGEQKIDDLVLSNKPAAK
jgi:hypothetical protein